MRNKLELSIIILLFTLLIYLIYTNHEYEKTDRIKELNNVIQKQEEVIKNIQKYQDLNELSIDIKHIKEEIERYHKH